MNLVLFGFIIDTASLVHERHSQDIHCYNTSATCSVLMWELRGRAGLLALLKYELKYCKIVLNAKCKKIF